MKRSNGLSTASSGSSWSRALVAGSSFWSGYAQWRRRLLGYERARTSSLASGAVRSDDSSWVGISRPNDTPQTKPMVPSPSRTSPADRARRAPFRGPSVCIWRRSAIRFIGQACVSPSGSRCYLVRSSTRLELPQLRSTPSSDGYRVNAVQAVTSGNVLPTNVLRHLSFSVLSPYDVVVLDDRPRRHGAPGALCYHPAETPRISSRDRVCQFAQRKGPNHGRGSCVLPLGPRYDHFRP